MSGFWLLWGCFSSTTPKKKEPSCSPYQLESLTSCAGKDRSFQECRFHLRATGTPNKAWCESLRREAKSAPPVDGRCSRESPALWQRVDCATYALANVTDCYLCNDIQQAETNRIHIYGYNSGCTYAIEQSTCNTDPTNKKLFVSPQK